MGDGSDDGDVGHEDAGSNGGDVHGSAKKRKRGKRLPGGKRQAMKRQQQTEDD